MMAEWDKFIEYHYSCVEYNKLEDFEVLEVGDKEKALEMFYTRFIVFKYENRNSYERYRETFQILDVACLNTEIMRFSQKTVAASLMYLMVSKYFSESLYALLHYEGDDQGGFLFNEETACENPQIVDSLFGEFANETIELRKVADVSECVEFLYEYLEFDVLLDLPLACRVKGPEKVREHYEDFLVYQTHNVNNMEFITEKVK